MHEEVRVGGIHHSVYSKDRFSILCSIRTGLELKF